MLIPETGSSRFWLNLPIIAAENIHRLKEVINVGFWQGDPHVKVQTPPVVAYHDSNPNLYLVPNLRMCTLSKKIHYLCPSKPFIRDSTSGICGLRPMISESQCPATVTPKYQITSTQAEIVANRWLVNTPSREATLTYDQHDTSDRIPLPSQTFWVDVPNNVILHVEDLTLYHLNPDQYESEIKVSDFFAKHTLELDPNTLEKIQYEGTQRVMELEADRTPHEPIYVDEAGFNLAKTRRRGRNIIGKRATINVPATGIQQPHDLPTGSHPIPTAPVNLPGPATLHLLPYKLFPVFRVCSTGLQDCQSGSHPEETLTGPVSLSFLSKILERAVYNQLSFFLSQNQLQDINQSGLKPAHSTETALIAVTESLQTARSAKLSSVLILLDLSAAFDTVNHKILLSVLTDLGITGTAWKWFESYLEDRHYQVTWNGSTSAPCRLSTGVPQGSVLGPLLFTLFLLAK
ncbi:hypothetical protein NFI96_024789 [Prochilodus magdalenae]|nr:hypothetical protein NFI96_024789 [Prochilodus magdalenae]